MDNSFQIILIGVFIVAAVAGVAVFALGGLSSEGDNQINVNFTIWGEWNDDTFNELLDITGVADSDGITIDYQSVPSGQLEDRLVNALARGSGPDVLLIPHTRLVQLSDLIANIGSGAYAPRTFRNTFVEGAEIYLSNEGVSALPVAMDPIVMYWNRDILTRAGFLSPPVSWEELAMYARDITQVDADDRIETAAISFGLSDNVSASKEILSSLFLQAGNPVVDQTAADRYVVRLTENIQASESAVGLYTQYANPNSSNYSWSNSLQLDREEFAAGNLAMMLAPASDINLIRSQNPNLNFDVAPIPQLKGQPARTFATVYGFSVLTRAQNKLSILDALKRITDADMARAVANKTNFTPVRRDVLSELVSDPYRQVFRDAAITARGWLDPDPEATDSIFADLIGNITSGRSSTRGAIQRAETAIQNLF
jgi:multiple sugar transport system substrate-binding protein